MGGSFRAPSVTIHTHHATAHPEDRSTKPWLSLPKIATGKANGRLHENVLNCALLKRTHTYTLKLERQISQKKNMHRVFNSMIEGAIPGRGHDSNQGIAILHCYKKTATITNDYRNQLLPTAIYTYTTKNCVHPRLLLVVFENDTLRMLLSSIIVNTENGAKIHEMLAERYRNPPLAICVVKLYQQVVQKRQNSRRGFR